MLMQHWLLAKNRRCPSGPGGFFMPAMRLVLKRIASTQGAATALEVDYLAGDQAAIEGFRTLAPDGGVLAVEQVLHTKTQGAAWQLVTAQQVGDSVTVQ